MGVFALMVVAVLCMQLHPQFLSSRWMTKRLAMYIFLGGYGVIPALHWIYLNGGWHTHTVQVQVQTVQIPTFEISIKFLLIVSAKFKMP